MTTHMRMDLTGKKFNRLTVLGKAKVVGQKGQQVQRWDCMCECGTNTNVRTAALKNGQVKSCGCLRGVNQRGVNNYRVREFIAKYGEWIPSKTYWYARSKQIIYRAKKTNTPIEFESAYELTRYLESQEVDICPVFNEKLTNNPVNGRAHHWTPSVDRVDPHKGYVRGNMQIISNLANVMKNDATPDLLYKFALWVIKERFRAMGLTNALEQLRNDILTICQTVQKKGEQNG
jgi:hypothetical protein